MGTGLQSSTTHLVLASLVEGVLPILPELTLSEESAAASGLLVSVPGLDIAVQRDFGDLQCPANLRNRVFGIIIEGLGNKYLSGS
jgi:hypothetical protein